MKHLAALLLTLIIVAPVWATDRYVDNATSGCSTPTDTDYNPSTRSCGSGSELVYSTWASALAAESPNDNIYGRGAEYTEGISDTIASGTGPGFTNTTKLIGWPSEQVILKPNTQVGSACALHLGNTRNHIEVQNIIFDADLCTAGAATRVGSSSQPSPRPSYIRFRQVTAKNSVNTGLLAAADNLEVYDSIYQNNGDSANDHGIYWSAGANGIFQRNQFLGNSGTGIQFYPTSTQATFEYNFCKDNGGVCVAMGGDHETIRYNIMVAKSSNTRVIQLSTGSQTVGGSVVAHNVFYRAGTASGTGFLKTRSGTMTVANNIAIGFTTGFSDTSSTWTQIDNLSSGTATDLWTDPASDDFTLKAGSAAINGGTDIGLAFCSTAPDQGAFERPGITAATISGNVVLVTVCNIAPPIQPGTFTVARSGGSPTVLSTSLQGGSGGIVRLEVSETCAAAQTWTVSAGTTTTDSTLNGNSLNQPLHTTTNFPVDSSACDGTGGPSAPSGEVAHYAFDGNLNDSSGNGNTGTGSNISYTTGRSGQGVLTTVSVDSHIDTGLLSGHNPSTDHLVVATWVYIDQANLGQTKDIWGTAIGSTQQFIFYRHSGNTWRMLIAGQGGTASEFPVVAGWTHGCIKMNPTGDIATMYINGVAGTTSGASVISSYGSYTLASDLRFGLPSGFAANLSGAHIYDDAYIYTTDVSCTDLYDAGQPSTGSAMAVQATHQWQGVFTASGGSAENRGAADAQRTVVKSGAASIMVQINCTGGDCGVVQPRFRYNVNGGSFTNVVPDSPTADGVSYWGASLPSGLNNGLADGPISGALTHTDGITLTTSVAIPTITLLGDTSYTLRGIFLIDAAINDVVCFKIYDQGGSALTSYTPTDGACLTVIAPQAAGGY